MDKFRQSISNILDKDPKEWTEEETKLAIEMAKPLLKPLGNFLGAITELGNKFGLNKDQTKNLSLSLLDFMDYLDKNKKHISIEGLAELAKEAANFMKKNNLNHLTRKNLYDLCYRKP